MGLINILLWRVFMRLVLVFLVSCFVSSVSANAAKIESKYTKLDFENGCSWNKAASEEEASMGGSAICPGFKSNGKHWPVYFAEGDLRQFVSFGPIVDLNSFAGGFSQWNSVNTTIEWRLLNGRPFATILRWFIDNVDSKTGSADKKRQGNVLVISKVAQPNSPKSCVIGYVDTKANSNANKLARNIADQFGIDFVCDVDEARFYGERGVSSGSPRELVGDQQRY